MRELDAEIDVLNRSVDLQKKALDYVKAQHDLGAVSGSTSCSRQSLLDSDARAGATAAESARAIRARDRRARRHARAAVLDRARGDRAPAAADSARRAERRVATQARCRLGRARDGRRQRADRRREGGVLSEPHVERHGRLGEHAVRQPVQRAESDVDASARWSSQVLFDGGRRAADVDFANEGYVAAVANYRQTVLNAFQQVQDGIAGLSVLDGAAKQSHEAVDDAQRLLSLANDRYSGGLVAYLDVITAQQSAAHQRASGRADSRPADDRVGRAREGAGRRLGRDMTQRTTTQDMANADARRRRWLPRGELDRTRKQDARETRIVGLNKTVRTHCTPRGRA